MTSISLQDNMNQEVRAQNEDLQDSRMQTGPQFKDQVVDHITTCVVVRDHVVNPTPKSTKLQNTKDKANQVEVEVNFKDQVMSDSMAQLGCLPSDPPPGGFNVHAIQNGEIHNKLHQADQTRELNSLVRPCTFYPDRRGPDYKGQLIDPIDAANRGGGRLEIDPVEAERIEEIKQPSKENTLKTTDTISIKEKVEANRPTSRQPSSHEIGTKRCLSLRWSRVLLVLLMTIVLIGIIAGSLCGIADACKSNSRQTSTKLKQQNENQINDELANQTGDIATPTMGPSTVTDDDINKQNRLRPIETTQQLYDAVDMYILSQHRNESNISFVAEVYGYPIGEWDVSFIEDFSSLFCGFLGCRSFLDYSEADHNESTLYLIQTFNEDINKWNVSNAKNMTRMFYGASSFNKDLDKWDTSSVESMGQMFRHASAFNGNISTWNTSQVTDMYGMFSQASSFEGKGSGISRWDCSKVQNMDSMFLNASKFSGDLSKWDTSSLQEMSYMFYLAASFDSDLSGWNISNVKSLDGVFSLSGFSGSGVSNWDVSKVQSMDMTFLEAWYFNANLTSWETSNVEIMDQTFYESISFEGIGVETWDVSKVRSMIGTFARALLFEADLSNWNTSAVTDMFGMFQMSSFSGSGISQWNVSNVRDMSFMFYENAYIDADLYSWDTSRVSSMHGMFWNASSFQGNGLLSWNVPNVESMEMMFFGAASFEEDLSGWDTSSLTNIRSMFSLANSFTGAGLEGWDVSKVKDMTLTFAGAVSFDGNLSRWNTNSVLSMAYMFSDATSFTGRGGLDNWNVSAVSDMRNMFVNAHSFSSDLSGWQTSNVFDMKGMFAFASLFNSDLSAWNVSNVYTTELMFRYANSFNHSLCSWGKMLPSYTQTEGMFQESGCPVAGDPIRANLTDGPFCHLCTT